MKITELTKEQKKIFCRTMAACGFYEETDSAYSNALTFLGIDEPLDEEFNYTDGIGGDRIGGTPEGNKSWKGSFGPFRIYNRALNADDILQNFNAQRGRFGL